MRDAELIERHTSGNIIGAFYEVYNAHGFGLLEHVYILALERELAARGCQIGREVTVPIMYKGEQLTTQRLDLVVDGKVVIEVKSTHVLPSTAKRQAFNYLQATNLEVALLLQFGPDARFYRVVHSRRS